MKKLILGAATLFLALAAQASGVITISGKLNSITEKYFLVETDKAIYHIDKSAVPPSEAAKLTRTEVPVTLSVPMEAIGPVKTKDKRHPKD